MATTVCAACNRKFLMQLNNQMYCVDCFNAVKAKEKS